MYCPQCGQQQAPGEVRFCSRCGLPLGGVHQLLAHGGALPNYNPPAATEPQEPSARRRGVKQGVTMIMLGLMLTILFGILSSYLNTPEMFTAIAAVIGFVGGPLRILYAAIFEEGAKPQYQAMPAYYVTPATPPVLHAPPRHAALPPQQSAPPVPNWPRRPNTAELVSPPSVTENTTRLLDREPETPER
jgi:hypothetical protein